MGMNRNVALFAAAALTIASGSGIARAQSRAPGMVAPSPSPAEPTEQVTTSYGWQILAMDAVVIGATVASESEEILVGGYVFGGPLVHMFNGQPKTALGSLALRTALPMLGAAVGSSTADCDDNAEEFLCGLGEAVVGIMIGATLATAIDAAVLARKQVTRPRAAFEYRGVSANPQLGMSRDGDFTLGLSGNF